MSVFGICVFLWLADVIRAIGGIFFCAGWLLIGSVVGMELIKTDDARDIFTSIIKHKKALIIGTVLWIMAGLIPSKQAVYMIGGTIAGSEIISKVADSKEYKKLMELFNLALDKQIKELKESK